MTKTVLITGVLGQDGAYLAKHALEQGWRVVGGARRSASGSLWRLDELGVTGDVELADLELLEESNLRRLIDRVKPDRVFNLAAQSFVGVSFDQPVFTADVDALGVVRLLEAVREAAPETRFYQASTSEMFGKVAETPQRETTPFHPRSPYGVAKLFGHWITVNYREAHGLHASTGILFNHESPLRGLEFVTRKITAGLARVAEGQQEKISLGNVEALRDWGHAADYVRAMWAMTEAETGDDFVVATGETHSVRAFVEAAAAAAEMPIEWRGEGLSLEAVDTRSGKVVVDVDPRFFRPAEVDLLLGDPSKARDRLGWRPEIPFEQLVTEMVEADRRRARAGRILH